MNNGTCSELHSANPEAFQAWIRKLESKEDNAPLDWIRNMTIKEPDNRWKPEQLMTRILSCDDECAYYGLCCDGKEEHNVAVELRDSEAENFSGSEGATISHSGKCLLLTTSRNRSI